MPRWPAGLHPQTGVQNADMRPPLRTAPIPQESYWRRATAELKAATPPVTVSAGGAAASLIGPAGVGEVWQVTLVQVQVQPALNTRACTAQVWRAASGVLLNLLSSTSNGGFDDLGVTGPPLRAGEQIAVTWAGATPGNVAWATIEGVKFALVAYAGQA